jgi:hypothetical protein
LSTVRCRRSPRGGARAAPADPARRGAGAARRRPPRGRERRLGAAGLGGRGCGRQPPADRDEPRRGAARRRRHPAAQPLRASARGPAGPIPADARATPLPARKPGQAGADRQRLPAWLQLWALSAAHDGPDEPSGPTRAR